jgi:uncharacterized protein (TIGR02284 family)
MHAVAPPVGLVGSLDDERIEARSAALEALYDRTVDSLKGFSKMVEKAEPSFRDIAEKFRSLHARQAVALARFLADKGVEVDGDGSIMGTVNEAVVTFRAFFDDIDEDVMDQIRSGEDWVQNAFDEAIAEQDISDAQIAIKLREMQAELTELLAETGDIG